ncbi:MAG: LPS export ABC transporter ATP-binding protein [Vampirovibrionales bacterium]
MVLSSIASLSQSLPFSSNPPAQENTHTQKPLTLKASHLFKTYQKRSVVSDVSFEVSSGEVVALLGPNGAGKTTSFYMVAGVIRPDEGSITLGEKRLDDDGIHERAKAGLGYLPQETSVFRSLSVWDNLMLVLEHQPMSKQEAKRKANDLLEEFGLARLKQKPAVQLSGGERRRVEIARALASNPQFILLDEPFTGIDPITIEDLQVLIRHLAQRGLGVLITDHNPNATLNIADRGYILIDGKVIFSGSNTAIATNPIVKQAYLGEGFHYVTQAITPSSVNP